jgi:hypothetical protein
LDGLDEELATVDRYKLLIGSVRKLLLACGCDMEEATASSTCAAAGGGIEGVRATSCGVIGMSGGKSEVVVSAGFASALKNLSRGVATWTLFWRGRCELEAAAAEVVTTAGARS